MKKTGYSKYIQKLFIIVAGALLFFSVFTLMNHVQNLLNTDVKINLTEIVTQNRDVVTSKLNVEMNNLDNISGQMSENLKRVGGVEHFVEAFQTYLEDVRNERIFVADQNGIATFSDHSTVDVSGRNYYRLSMNNIQNISDKVISRKDGQEVFIISVPLTYEEKVVGSVQKIYTTDEMYKLCKLSLFSSQGYMNIINGDGYILVNSENKKYNQESDNFYRSIYAKGNKKESTQLQKDIKNEKTGFMETTENDTKIFSAYTPIVGVHDWYLISSIPTNAVSSNASIVIKMFYVILCFIVVIFALGFWYFLSYKNKQQNALEKIAFFDPVTQGNTYNRFTIDLQERLLKYPMKQYYLMILDIDNFKYVNGYYGFDVGDKILYQINHAIMRNLYDHEATGRISSDHFLVLLSDVSEERLNRIINDIKQNDQELKLYFTAGIYHIKDREEGINLMVDKASMAAHATKDTLNKRIEFYSEKYDQLMIHNELLKREVEEALTNSEMIPFFQPKIHVDDRTLVGAEALARWRKPDGHLIPPIDFIPMCEKTGLIVKLDMIIFEKTLQFIRKQLDEGVECVPISVNFSRSHLLETDFVPQLMELINQYQIPSELIELELTESVLLDNPDLIKDFIHLVHQNGLKISMDDFGSGYSSLNMLKDVHIDVLKVDQVFLQETNEEERQKVILAAIAEMARKLNIKVVVEGVETPAQVKLMEDVGCYIAQGYYYAKPMDMESFEKVYQEGKV